MFDVLKPLTHRALVREQAVQAKTAPKARGGKIVGVLSAKGGCGATTIAINLSAAIADKIGHTILVDANLQNPDAGLLLGKQMEYGLLELITGASEPTPEAVEACTVPIMGRQHEWSLLAPPSTGEGALKTHLTDVAACLRSARAVSDYWVVDLPNHLDRHLVTMLDACDVVLVVFEETVAGVSAARRWWNTFSQLGYASSKIVYVMNRAGSRTAAGAAKVTELLPEGCSAIPNCFNLLDDSMLHSAPPVVASPKHKFSEAMRNLAQQIKERIEEVSNG